MTPDAALAALVDALDAAAIPYMLVGSLASNLHGVPRATRDADLVVDLEADGLGRLAGALPRGLELQPQAAFEGVTATRRHLITLSGSAFVCELFVRSDDAHDLERFARRRRITVLGKPTWVASAEDMVVTKLRWAVEAHRSKDRDDMRNIIAVRGRDLDWPYIERWASLHGTRALLDEIRQSVAWL